jgi:glycosyltransferase involved in cell wall biosynthesis
MKKLTVLHITPHLGLGVGSVLLKYIGEANKDPDFVHEIITLEYANKKALLASRKIGFSLKDKMASKHKEILRAIANADIVLIHWWNHPLLYDFLIREKLPANRMIMWSHNSGFQSPYVYTKKILQYPDVFVFTTPISFETREVKGLSDKRKKSLRVVWSTGGVKHIKSIKPKKHSGFNVGYVGTVDYAKIHPNFLNLCSKVDIPDVKFIVCGGPKEKEIEEEARKLGIAGKFKFTGLVSDITKYLSIFDVFGYPLSQYHYGTGEQALQESMAAGVVPVVMRNRTEKYIVKDGITGIVAKSENDYIRAIQTLYKNKTLRNSLSQNARDYAIKNFSVDKIVRDWNEIFKEILTIPKTSKKWEIAGKNNKISTTDIFLEALGDHGKCFVRYLNSRSKNEKEKAIRGIIKLNEIPIWRADSKGTVHHYNSFFPSDRYIAFWSKLMKGAESNKK